MTTLKQLLTNTAPQPVTITQSSLAVPLMPFQIEAVNHILRGKPHTLLAHEMGLGKTIDAICVAQSAKDSGLGKTLVVCPPVLVFNWIKEFSKFAPTMTVARLQGQTVTNVPNADVIVVGDSVISHWAESLLNKFDVLIVDESQRFKKDKTQRTKALREIAETIPHLRILMSGTPNPNGKHQELISQIDILGYEAWNDLGGRGRFWNHFCPKTDSWGNRGNANGEELHELLTSTFMHRMVRSDVLTDLPSKGRTPLYLECVGSAAKDYCHAEDDLIAYLSDNDMDTKGAMKSEALVKLNIMRRLAGVAKVRGIVDRVKDILDDSTGGVFVVAEHREVIDKLKIGLNAFHPVSIRGGMSENERQRAVELFNNGSSRVLIGQIVSAGVGLTLHGGGQNHRVVVAQLPWSPADLKQAEDRLHRIGQTHDVTVEIALASIENRVTVDERIWNVLENKNFNLSTVLDGEGEYLMEDAQDGVIDSYRY